MATYTIRENKLEILIAAHNNGSEINEETVAEILHIKTPKAIKAYVKAFNERNDQEETLEETEQEAPSVEVPHIVKEKRKFSKPKAKTPKDLKYFVEDENGVEVEHEAIAVTDNAIMLKKVEPILKNVTIGGETIQVDLRRLRKLDPDQKFAGVKVSNLLIAAELA